MRKSSIILSATVIAVSAITAISIAVFPRQKEPKANDKVTPAQRNIPRSPPTTTRIDPIEVFQKAFWKRPTDADKILHAERREWTEAGDIRKWEWFLVVKPSPPLLKHLIEENAFNLPACRTSPPGDEAPAWFTYDPSRLETIGAARAGLRLSFDKTSGLLYATDRGGGFQPGVPETPQAAPTSHPDVRRFSATPPTDPRKP